MNNVQTISGTTAERAVAVVFFVFFFNSLLGHQSIVAVDSRHARLSLFCRVSRYEHNDLRMSVSQRVCQILKVASNLSASAELSGEGDLNVFH